MWGILLTAGMVLAIVAFFGRIIWEEDKAEREFNKWIVSKWKYHR